ncbi:hypothetical protein ANO14919_026960 [Xylariales sp. No.14919]|nr:hypothetical protein ANO14919_026960 [Xylariales sp. No.14919]
MPLFQGKDPKDKKGNKAKKGDPRPPYQYTNQEVENVHFNHSERPSTSGKKDEPNKLKKTKK